MSNWRGLSPTWMLIIKLVAIGVLLLVIYLSRVGNPIFVSESNFPKSTGSDSKSEDEWKKILTPEQYAVLREKGTETPYTGELLHEKRKGTYYSFGCDKPLFRSEDKYDSGTGWPSFTKPITESAITLAKDYDLGIERTEVLDPCGGHLGHVFDDGPDTLPDGRQATGKRFCINSVALYFIPDEK